MKKLLLITMLFPLISYGQFVSQGKITFERKTNLRQRLETEESDNSWYKDHLNDYAQYTIAEFSLSFNRDAILYQFEKDQEVKGSTLSWWGTVAAKNKVYINLKNGKELAKKRFMKRII